MFLTLYEAKLYFNLYLCLLTKLHSRPLLDQQLLCTSLLQQAACVVARSLHNAEDVEKLDIPREVKDVVIMMAVGG